MKNHLKVISLSSIIVGVVIFTVMQMSSNAYASDKEAPENESRMAEKTVTNMIRLYKQKKWKKFKSCWHSKKNKEIKEQLSAFEDDFPTSFEPMECVIGKGESGLIIVRGMIDSAPEVFEFKMHKVKNSFKIKSIEKKFM